LTNLQYAILLASALNSIAKYSINIIEFRHARTHGGETAPPWENKSMYLFYIELFTGTQGIVILPLRRLLPAVDFMKLATYLLFFSLIIVKHGLPLNMIRDVYITARSFVTRFRALTRYLSATRDMDRRYANATEAELNEMSDRTCIICRDELALRDPRTQQAGPNTTPKKLPCGHIFHFNCLRSWLERQQSCPTW
jgi:E3 ubiquitin-protein ligase synoviolin